jgi:hypothetical protein
MRRFSILTTIIVLASLLLIVAGCSKNTSPTSTSQPSADEQAIRTLLGSSEYALPTDFHNDEQYQTEGLTGVGSEGHVNQDGVVTLPWVRFFRVMRVAPRVEYLVLIPGSEGDSTADVRIAYHLMGAFVVDNTDDDVINPFLRPFTSIAATNVMARLTHDGWRIVKISPTNIHSSNDGGTTIHIEWMMAEGSSHTFPMSSILSPDTLLALYELPAFAPGDTVRVRAKALNTNPDGCWLFLHVHCGYAASVFHLRVPFVRDASDSTLYYAAWVVPTGIEAPRVFHMAVDGIDWNTLFGDRTAIYNSRMWSVPCLIGFPQMVNE